MKMHTEVTVSFAINHSYCLLSIF